MGDLIKANFGTLTDAKKGERQKIMQELRLLATQLLDAVDLEIAGLRDGDGFWHGGDPIDYLANEIARANLRHRASWK